MESKNQEKDCANSNTTKENANPDFEIELPNQSYYLLYRRLYAEALKLREQHSLMKEKQKWTVNRISYLSQQVDNFKDYICPSETAPKKFERRGADQITKQYVCPVQKCNRAYGSETAYRKHLKLKHPTEYSPKKRGRCHNINDRQMILQL